MSRLGRYGRTANQIFQASFLHCYSKLHGLEAQAPAYPAQSIFECDFRPVSVRLPEKEERYRDAKHKNMPIDPDGEEFVGHDFCGYAQFHTSWYRPFKDDLQGMVNRRRTIPHHRPVIGIHIRLGDYDQKTVKWRCPIQWYLDWLEEHWSRFDRPLLYVAAEEQHVYDRFEKYLEEGSCSPDPARMSVDSDWLVLNQCDVVLCPNSTYSFAAAWLSTHIKEAWRASLPDEGFVKFDPWDATPLLYDFIEDYPHIKEICP